MEFTNRPLELFGRELAAVTIPTNLGYKAPLIFRFIRLLTENECIAKETQSMAELCLDEAFTNAMMHGNRVDPDKQIRAWVFCDDERWGCIIEDEGEGFGQEDLPDNSPQNLLRETGRGIMLMEGYLDSLLYNEKGNRLMMVRHREEPEEAEVVAAVPAAEEEGDDLIMDFANITREEDIAILEILDSRLSDKNIDAFRREIDEALLDANSLVLALDKVEYLSSVVIGAIMTTYKRVRAKKGAMVLCGAGPTILQVLRSVNLHRLMELVPDQETALAKLRESE